MRGFLRDMSVFPIRWRCDVRVMLENADHVSTTGRWCQRILLRQRFTC
jgi:hypothetical protein